MQIVTVPCHFDNFAYILLCERSGEAAIVDPAEYYPVYAAVEKLQLNVNAVFCTHHHNDHIGGLEELRAERPGLNIYGHVTDAERITGLNQPVADGDAVTFGNIKGQVYHTPGHTSGSVCYLFENNLFSGDTVFGAGCGRLFEGTPDQMYRSLSALASKVSGAAKVYFGHEYTLQNLKFAEFIEPENEVIQQRIATCKEQRQKDEPTTPSTFSEEIQTNPFFRCNMEEVVQGVQKKLFVKAETPEAVFAALRKQKDSF